MTKRRQPAKPRIIGERDEHMTHCTNCSCPMTCNAFERCVREPEVVQTLGAQQNASSGYLELLRAVGQNQAASRFARSATPHRAKTP